MRKIFLLLAPLFLAALSFRSPVYFTITGKVTNESGQPMASVNITHKSSKVSVVSNSGGGYSISIPEKTGVLIFAMVGYETKQIKIEGKTVVNVIMKTATANLKEVAVVGYGAQRKKDVTGSVSQNELRSYTSPSVAKSLQGRVAGVQTSGYPGHYNQTEFNTEAYDNINENGFKKASDDPLSTFSIDVDAASYSNVRRFLNEGKLPPAGAVRVEEMINYFRYNYDLPNGKDPFSVDTEIAACPWNQKHQLALIGLQGKKIPVENLPSSNFVFLIDVSGSMFDEKKLPLVKASLKLLVDQLREQDRVAIVVYAGAAGLVLPSTDGSNKTKIKDAIEQLSAGGSTAGGQGIKLAYKVAKENFAKEGNNRVILCTDGDFNIGASSDDEMERLIEEERKSGVFLTVLGYGMGNYKDSKMQKLADKGNGNHAYIDGLNEAKKVLVNEFSGTMFTIAKDVKLQIEFNPAKVAGYRLIGYENRILNKEDFNNDKKDAGELGSGHTITALYEIVPAGVETEFLKEVDDLKYQKNKKAKTQDESDIMNIKLRYKDAGSEVSKLIEHPVMDKRVEIENTSDNFRFAAAVAQFGMLLRNSEFKQASSYKSILALADNAKGKDEEGYRKEFIKLVKKASVLQTNDDAVAYSDEE
jgi:Ca-activated chloride channel family protein